MPHKKIIPAKIEKFGSKCSLRFRCHCRPYRAELRRMKPSLKKKPLIFRRHVIMIDALTQATDRVGFFEPKFDIIRILMSFIPFKVDKI